MIIYNTSRQLLYVHNMTRKIQSRINSLVYYIRKDINLNKHPKSSYVTYEIFEISQISN